MPEIICSNVGEFQGNCPNGFFEINQNWLQFIDPSVFGSVFASVFIPTFSLFLLSVCIGFVLNQVR